MLLFISGCVSPEVATPAPTPAPAETPVPATATPTPSIPPAIAVLSYPASVNGEENYTIGWEISGTGDISRTAIYWSYKSGANISDYTRVSSGFKGKSPAQFSAELKAPAGGDWIYFRAYAMVEDIELFSDEFRIAIIPRYTGGGGGY